VIRRFLPGVALAVVVAVALVVGGSGRGGGFRSAAARAEAIAEDLRCPVCQGLSVADSHSPTAEAMYDDIRRRVEAGESDSAIKGYYVSRYSEWVLLDPDPSGVGVEVWILPVAVLLVAVGGLALAFRRWRRQPGRVATDEDRALVEAALARRHEGDR
jgi:cytochrome c-type biogenesis protein CcmH